MSSSHRVTIDLRGFERYLKTLGSQMKPAIERGMERAAQAIIPVLHQSVHNAPPASPNGSVGAYDTGGYRGGFRVRRTAKGVIITNSRPHGPVVEKGRRAGRAMPPVQVIEEWARRKMGLTRAEAKKAAYPIAKAISKRGLRGRRVVGSQREKMMSIIRSEVRISLEEAKRAARTAAGSRRKP